MSVSTVAVDEQLPAALRECDVDDNSPSDVAMLARALNAASNDVDDSSGDDELDDLERVECSWPCSTVLHGKGVIDDGFVQVMQRYFAKRGDALWEASARVSSSHDENNSSGPDDDDEVDDTQFRKCSVAKDTSTLKRLYGMIDTAVEDVVDMYLQKYPYFSVVSTKDDYTLVRYKHGDFYAEHIEVSGLDDDCDGAARRLCIMVFLGDPPSEGGQLQFPYQDVLMTPQLGDVIVFPACPLHPNRITPVTGTGTLTYAFNYLL